jgi:hypothetical protein
MIKIKSSTYYKIITLSFIGLLLCFNPIGAATQNSKNPFEIKNRINDNPVTGVDTSGVIDSIIVDTTAISNSITANESQNNQILNSNENPFEVDHVPLRKKDVVHKINNQRNLLKSEDPAPSKSFIYWFLILGLTILTLASTAQKKLISKVSKSIFNENILKQEHRSGNSFTLEYLLLYLVYFINAAIFLLLVWNYFLTGEISLKNFGFCLVLLFGIYNIRHITMSLFGFIFPLEKEAGLYSFTIQLFNAFLGIILIPINLFLAFAPENITKIVLFLGLSLIAILLTIRLIRGLTIAINYVFNNIILFFIYLCALEIAPILVLVKVLSTI